MKADDFYIEKHVNLFYTNRSNQRSSVKSNNVYFLQFTLTPKSPITSVYVIGLLGVIVNCKK